MSGTNLPRSIRRGRSFRRRCGLVPRRACSRCGPMVSRGSRSFAVCGSLSAAALASLPVTYVAPASTVPGFVSENERKFLTAMFADIVGSTGLEGGFHPEPSIVTLEIIVQIVFGTARTCGGTVNRAPSNGNMALSDAPVVNVNHAIRACPARLRLIDETNKLISPQVRVGVGLHFGPVVWAINNDVPIPYEADEPAMHLAAQIEQLCPPGTVRTSAATCLLASVRVAATGADCSGIIVLPRASG